MRKVLIIAVSALAVGGLIVWYESNHKAPTNPPAHTSEQTSPQIVAPEITRRSKPPRPPARPSTITMLPASGSASRLNAEGQSVDDDLAIVQSLLRGYRTALDGNPVGLNDEITAALVGRNRKGAAVLTREHPEINSDGELTDRWGTPFKFHAISATRMEVRSAGPDRQMFTSDDATLEE